MDAVRWSRWVTAIPSEAAAWRDAGASLTQARLCLRRGIIDPDAEVRWLTDTGSWFGGGTAGQAAELIRLLQS